MNEQVQDELKKIFDGRFSTSESTRANYARGEDTYEPVLSQAVVFPETNEEVSQILEKCYESVVVEAKAWETDAHDDHTIEAYMCENAALVAGLAAKACKDCKEEYGEEAYEAALNMIKEAFSNKIEEIKITMNGETPADAEEKSAD